MSSKSQTTGTNSKVDPLKGYIAKLDNRNVFPLVSEKDIEIERKRPDGLESIAEENGFFLENKP